MLRGVIGGGGSGTPGGLNTQIQYNNANSFGGFTVSGDGTLNTSTGALTVTKTNGTSFATVATSGSASDLSAGTLAVGRGGTGVSTTVAYAQALLASGYFPLSGFGGL